MPPPEDKMEALVILRMAAEHLQTVLGATKVSELMPLYEEGLCPSVPGKALEQCDLLIGFINRVESES